MALAAEEDVVWTPECEAELIQIKAVLTDERFLKAFDSTLYTVLLVDTSKVTGAGYIIIQHTQAGMVNILIQHTQVGMVNIVWCGNVTAKRSWASMAPIEAEATDIDWVVCPSSPSASGTSGLT